MNASLVEIDLGFRNYRYLGLVLIDEEYASIPKTQPFIIPAYLGLLVILLIVKLCNLKINIIKKKDWI